MTEQLTLGGKLAHNIGLVVLASQDLERHLKMVVAASADDGDIIARHKKLERRALGEVVSRFMKGVTVTQGNPEALERYFTQLLDRRNRVVHHFFDTYGEALQDGRYTEVLAELGALYEELRDIARAFRGVNEAWLASLQDE